MLLEDATGAVPVFVATSTPDARLLNRRVLATSWSLVRCGGESGTAYLETAGLIALDDETRGTATPLPEPADAASRAPPPPKKGGGITVRGAVVAVSPVVSLADPPSRFFLLELGKCARCGAEPGRGGGGGEGEGGEGGDDAPAFSRRIIFSGEAAARWRPFFVGGDRSRAGEGADAGDAVSDSASMTCAGGCVVVDNLRKSTLMKGEGSEREIRLAAATAATTATPGAWTLTAAIDADSRAADAAECPCDACVRGDTLARYEAMVTGVDPIGFGVILNGRGGGGGGGGGGGVPLIMTHATLTRRARGSLVPALRVGSKIVLTHAHPVWRRDDDDEGDDDDDDASGGLRAVGACVRTKITIASPSPYADGCPALFPSTAASDRDDADAWASGDALRRACEESGFVAAARVRELAVALGEKFDVWNSAEGRKRAERLLLGRKRRRSSLSGVDEFAGNGDGGGFDLDGALRALLGGGGGDDDDDAEAAAALVVKRDTLYREFFTPSGLGGDERRAPSLPTMRRVRERAIAAFARAAEEARDDENGNGNIPFGAGVGAVDVDRIVLRARDVCRRAAGAALFAWARVADAGVGGDGRARRVTAHDDTAEMDVLFEDGDGASGSPPPPHGAAFVATDWIVVCEGARASVGDASGATTRALPPRLREPRCYLRVNLASVIVASSPPPPPRPGPGPGFEARDRRPSARDRRRDGDEIKSVSDMLLWVPTEGRRGGWAPREREEEDGDAHRTKKTKPRPPPPGGVRVRTLATRHTAQSWPPPPSRNFSFTGIVIAERYSPDAFGRGWSLRWTLRDVRGGADAIDAYVNAPVESLPLGAGRGARVVVHGAHRHASASLSLYAKITAESVVEVATPARATMGDGACNEKSLRIGVHHADAVVRGPVYSGTRTTLRELTNGAALAGGVIDRRAWDVRARVVAVQQLTIRYGCRTCGCDAGTMGATDASRASRALAARADGGPEIENLIGCASCRPPPGTLPPKNACGFECEASCTIDDGVARADVWLSGAAGIGLFPPSLKRAAVALARKHGRVVARLDRAAGDDDEFRFHAHALRGYAALSVGEREGACVLAAVGHAQTLGEQVFTVSLAPRWHDAELPRGEGTFRCVLYTGSHTTALAW